MYPRTEGHACNLNDFSHSKDGCYQANPTVSALIAGGILLFKLGNPPRPQPPFEMLDSRTLPVIRVTYGGAPFVFSVCCAVSIPFHPLIIFSHETCAQVRRPFTQ